MAEIVVQLPKASFGEVARTFLEAEGLTVRLFRYHTGIEALRVANARGELVILPYLGGMIWDARFDGVALGMKSMFEAPRHAADIAGTYGCFAFHSGLLRNGCPSPEDDHALHGELPVAPMDAAELRLGTDAEGPYLAAISTREYVMGFGAHYRARPRVTVRPGRTLFDIGMQVENLGGAPMDLMYMCHMNYAFAAGARFVQSAPFTPEGTAVRTAIPGHVAATPAYRALIDRLAKDPRELETLATPEAYDPEQVFYLHGLRADRAGRTHVMMQRREGDGFVVSYDPAAFPHTVRWILYNPDQQVAAFALPSTCEPEGYLAEKRKGHVRRLAPGARAEFEVRTGYLDRAEAARMAGAIQQL